LKIAHFIQSIDISTGGPARSVTHLIEKILSISNNKILLFSSKSMNPILNKFKNNEGVVHFFKINWSYNLKFSQDLLKEVNLFHGHGLWQLPVHKMSIISRKSNIPYIITPRGMLEPWSLKQSKCKKKLAMLLFQNKDLKNASCIHATAQMEVENIRKLGFKNPIAMIPNGVNIDEFPNETPIKINNPKKILFLSRIHKKKGIENLIQAWKLIDIEKRKSWMIEIVGNGEPDYINMLKKRIFKENLNDQIIIKKPVYGNDKIKLFREASLFVLPSFSENFGIVIAEALASFTPVITTKGTPWMDLQTYKCGWWIEIGVLPLKNNLEEALLKSNTELKVMALNGRKLIENKYSMEVVSRQMLNLYDWIITKKNKPNFVAIYKKL